jgi:hypothetical protein
MCQIRQTLFLENTFARNRHIKVPKSAQTFRRMSRIRQNLFRENTFAQIRHIKMPISGILAPNCAFWLLEGFVPLFIFRNYESIYGLDASVPKKFRKLPSARRIFPKVFRRSHFWTSNSCPFPGNFFESCANRIEI